MMADAIDPPRKHRPWVLKVALDYVDQDNWHGVTACVFAMGFNQMQAKRLAALAYYFQTRGYDGKRD